MKKLTLDQLLGIIRHILTLVGGIMLVLGKQVDDGQIEMVTGATLALVTLLWSVFSKTDTEALKLEIKQLKSEVQLYKK